MSGTTTEAADRPARQAATRTALVIDWRWVIGALVGIGVFAGAFYLRHASQTSRLVDAMQFRAEELWKEEKWLDAASYYFRYLQLRPEQTQVWPQLADAYRRGAMTRTQKERAVEIHYRALGLVDDPAVKSTLNQHLAELLLELGRFSEAEDKAGTLGDSEEALRIVAQSKYARSRGGDSATKDEAFKALQAALNKRPGDVELAQWAAVMCREELVSPSRVERERIADQLIERMVTDETNQENPQAWLTSYYYRRTYNLPDAEAQIQKAVEVGSNDYEAVLAAAQHALEPLQRMAAEKNEQVFRSEAGQKPLAEAERWFRRAMELEPKKAAGYLGLGSVLVLQQKPAEALNTWRQGLKESTDDRIGLHDRLAVVLLSQNQLDDAARAIDDLRAATNDRVQQAALNMPRKEAILRRARVDFLQATLRLARGEVREGIRGLESVVSTWQNTLTDRERLADQLEAFQLLSVAYGRVGQRDRAAAAAEQAAQLAPGSAPLAQAAAAAWKLAGNWEKSLEHYRQTASVAREQMGAAAWCDVAEVQMARQLQQPPADQDWNAFQLALAQAESADPRFWRQKLLAAEQVFRTAGTAGQDQVVGLLAEAEARSPDDAALWQRLIVAYERVRRPEDADRALKRYTELSSKNPSASLMLAAELQNLRGQQQEARKLCDQALAQATGDQREAVLAQSVQLHLRAGNRDAARQGLLELHEMFPDGITYLEQLAEWDLSARDVANLQKWEDQLKTFEGEEGVHWRYYRARRLLLGVKSLGDAVIAEAAKLQQEIELRQPAWSLGHALKGLLGILRGNEQQAIDGYQNAVKLGRGDLTTVQTLVALLYRAQRFAEADAYLQQMRNIVPFSPSLSSLAASVSAQLDDLPQAVRRARQAAEQRPQDASAKILLAQMLELNEEHTESEKTLTQAATDHPKEAGVWAALFSYYLRRNEPEQAEQTLNALTEKSGSSPSERDFMAGQGYELLGNAERAEQLYRRAIEVDGTRAEPKVRLATLLLQRDPTEAEKLLRDVLKSDPPVAGARRLLAAILASRGSSEEWQEVQQLLKTEAGDPVDKRLNALLLARRGGAENLASARNLLKSLVSESNRPLPIDRLLLASLYDLEGKPSLAEEQYAELARNEKATAGQLEYYISFLLRQERPREAEPLLRRLDSLTTTAAASQRVRYVLQQARCLRMLDRPDEIGPFIEEFATATAPKAPDAPPVEGPSTETRPPANQAIIEHYDLVAQVYEALEMHDEAILWRRRLVALVPKAFPLLARDLCLAERHREAMDLVTKNVPDQASPEFIVMLASILTTGRTPPAVMIEVEPMLWQAAERYSDNADVSYALATVFALQDRNQDAAKLLERAYGIRPKDAATLNNLATILAEIPGREGEAERYIEEAIGIAGQQPFLLDTKATILARAKKAQQAIEILAQMVSLPNPDPRYFLHLAEAYDLDGQQESARTAYQQAVKKRVETQALTKGDKELLDQFRRRFGADVPQARRDEPRWWHGSGPRPIPRVELGTSVA